MTHDPLEANFTDEQSKHDAHFVGSEIRQLIGDIRTARESLTASSPGEQQPVAWRYRFVLRNGVKLDWKYSDDAVCAHDGIELEPLYTSPPPAAAGSNASAPNNDYYAIQAALSPHMASSTELMAAMSSIWPLIAVRTSAEARLKEALLEVANRASKKSEGEAERGKVLFDCICEDVEHRLNPGGDECPNCGGEGYIFDCFDGLCFDAESGCEDCMRRCHECARYKHARLKAIRLEVIETGDIDVAREWLKSVGRWSDNITPEQIKAELDAEEKKL